MNRRIFLGNLMHAVDNLLLPPLHSNQLWVRNMLLKINESDIEVATSRDRGFRRFIPGPRDISLEATFCGPGCLDLWNAWQSYGIPGDIATFGGVGAG